MATNRFLELFLEKLKGMIGSSPVAPSQEEVDAAFRAARAQAGGEASGAARGHAGTLDPSQPEPTAAELAAAGAIRLAAMAAADINDLPDSAFAYIEPGGEKDGEGKTVPRSKRHFPIHDAAHVRNALSRAPQSPFGDKAMPKIRAAAKSMGIGEPAAAEDEGELAAAYVSLRLDEGGGLPAWQVYHQVGDHGVHPKYGAIVFTKADGDAIIRNHQAGTLGRQVPLDFRHGTALDGEAGGWVEEFRWGRRGEGIADDPTGDGPILYARLSYNDIGRAKLQNEHYRHQSPEYDRNFQGRYGAVAMALAATNSPFLRGLRTLQGREQAPIMLDDARTQEDPTLGDNPQLHLPPQPAAAGPAAGTPQGVPRPAPQPPTQLNPQPHQKGPGFAAGAKCANCGTTQAGGEQYCSNCGMPAPVTSAVPPRPPIPPASPMGFEGGSHMAEGTNVQLDTVQLQQQLAEAQRRQAALEAQIADDHRVVAELQLDSRRKDINTLVDAAIYHGALPATVNIVRGLLLACDPSGPAVVRLSEGADATPITFEQGLRTLLEALPRLPIGTRRTLPDTDAPPAPAALEAADRLYAEAVKAKAAELNAERGVSARNGAAGA